MNSGIPDVIQSTTLRFDYNDISSLERLFADHPGEVAAVVLEPMTQASPCPRQCQPWTKLGPVCGSCALHAYNFLV